MMKYMIYLFLILGFAGLSNYGYAQKTKVLEKSTKKQPDWVNGMVQGFVIVTATSTTLDDAQQKALAKVKEQIISSVAENIQTSSEYYRKEDVQNNQSNFTEQFQTATKTRAADIPFLKGISATNVADFYWEKVQENDAVKYYYHIKYPFSKMQLDQLVREFEKADKALTDQLEGLLAKIDELNSVEEMGQTIKELQALADGFIDIDQRKDKANVGIAKLKEMLKNVSIETISATLGEIRVALKIGDKLVTTTYKPKVRSNCAKITEVKNDKTSWVITYTYDECYEDPDNLVNVEFRNAYGKTSNDYYFNINADKVDIFVNNDVNLTGGTDNGTQVENPKCHISITSKYDSPFVIDKVILNFGSEAPIIVDGLNVEFQGEGKHDLDFIINQSLDKEIYSSKKYNMIKGTISYKSSKSGEQSIYKMYNQPVTTSW